ncbi:MAG TPA: late competence protein ComER [Bacillota bacterium]|nr:late competence protein ComER [Bacillota bacterium]
MRVGFIGTGSMGSILIEAFITEGALQPNQITASNRTRNKVEKLSEKYPGLVVADSNRDAVEHSRVIFLCIKPLEFRKVIEEILPSLTDDHLVISITSPILIRDLEEQTPSRVIKVIPSITNCVAAGASLMVLGKRCSEDDRHFVFSLFSKISKPIVIDEAVIRVSSDIVSCGPAFMSYILQRFISAAVEETGISPEQATFLTTEMIVGLGQLISEGPFNLQTLQQRVCVPGGVTGAGLVALEEKLGDVFNQVFRNTHEKFQTDLEEIEQMFKK